MVKNKICIAIDAETQNKIFVGNDNETQVIFEDDLYAINNNHSSSRSASIPVTSGPGLLPYLKPGLRVIRGPDWKWGDQVMPFRLTNERL